MKNPALFLTVTLLACAASAYASGDTSADAFPDDPRQEVGLEKIIVTNRRASADSDTATENISVLSAEQIENLPAQNLNDVLRYIPGVDIAPGRGFGRGTSVSIQGSDSRQVRVMVDGIPFNNQASGQADLARLPLENIDRVEVVEGPLSSVWGSSLGGVINVITKDTGESVIPHGEARASFAEFRTRKQSGEVSGKAGPFGYYFSSSHMESGGRGPRDDTIDTNAFGKASYTLSPADKLIASFGYSGAEVNSGELPNGTWNAQPYRARYGKLSWERESPDAVMHVDLKTADQDIIFKTFFSVVDAEPAFIIRTNDLLYQLSVNSSYHPRENDLLVLGADFDWHTLKSTYLSETKGIQLAAPYANYTWALSPWDLNVGLRFDHNSEFGQQLSPSAGLVYHIPCVPDTSVRLGLSRAFNAPPLLWRHYDLILSGLTTNPGIKPERAYVYELGLESKPIASTWVKLSLYRADVSDAISRAMNDIGQLYMKNFQKFRRQGAQLQSRVNVTDSVSFSGSAAFNDIVDRATREVVRGGGRPRQSFSLGIDYKGKGGFDISLHGAYDRWNEPPDVEPNDRKMLLDVSLAQEFKNITLFLNIRNIANSKYWADFFLPVPGRYFEGGTSLKW